MIDISKPNEQIQELLKALDKISLMSVIGWEFKDQDVYLDGKEFVQCNFKNCRLISHLGHWQILIDSCVIKDSTFDFMYPASTIWKTTLQLQDKRIPLTPKSRIKTKNPPRHKK